MKRKLVRTLAWLTLPLVLCVLVWRVKWRAEHPTATNEDVTIQSFLSCSSTITLTHYRNSLQTYKTPISQTDFKAFVPNFYLMPLQSRSQSMSLGRRGLIVIDCLLPTAHESSKAPGRDALGMSVILDPEAGLGRCSGLGIESGQETNLHPVTVRRWLKLLLSNPSIGAELRARLKA